jgi:exodeoxyribonuclease VII small subunit
MDESTPEPLLIPDPAPEEIKVAEGAPAPASYEAAVERLEEIIDRLDSGQAGLRETLDLCREGKELVDYCAGELDAVGEGLKELNLDDLAARLDSSASPPGS